METAHPESFDASLATATLHIARGKLYWAAIESDFTATRAVLAAYPDILAGPLNTAEDGAIHLAVRSGKAHFVRYLLSEMSSYEELLRRDRHGETPLTYAALAGRSDIAELLVRRNREALLTRNGEERYPIYVAAFHGQDRVVRLLVDEAVEQDFDVDTWSEFVIVAVASKLYDAAYQIMDKLGSDLRPLVKMVLPEYRTVMHVLANNYTLAFSPSFDLQSRLLKRIWRGVVSLEEAEIETLFGQVESPPLVLEAMKVGNIGMVLMVVKVFPAMLYCVDSNGHGVFHFAVGCWEDTSTLRGNDCLLESLALKQDSEGNNLLHHAAKIPYSFAPSANDDLPTILKLKSEFSRFEAIQNDLPVKCQEMKNKEGLTPMKVFFREHEEMVKSSRIWLKSLAEASLLVTIMVMPILYSIIESTSNKKENKKLGHLIIFSMTGIQTVNFCVFRFWLMFFHEFSSKDFSTRLPISLGSALAFYFYFIIVTHVTTLLYVITATSSKLRNSSIFTFIMTAYACFAFYTSFPTVRLLRDICRPRRWRP